MSAEPPVISQEEQEQMLQTIEMFEVITQANPHDCQSLEILKDAFHRVGKMPEMLRVARQLADTYLHLGQYSSAMQEYEGILEHQPDNAEVMAALGEVEERLTKSGHTFPGSNGSRSNGAAPNGAKPISLDFQTASASTDPAHLMTTTATLRLDGSGMRVPVLAPDIEVKLQDDGNEPLAKFLVQHRIVPEEVVSSALERVQKKNREMKPNSIAVSLIDEICRRGSLNMDSLLSSVLDRSKFAYIPLEYYDVDRTIVRMLPDSLTLGRLIVPFDILSRTVMVATANPLDGLGKEAVQQLLDYNVQWHLASPAAITRVLQETYRIGA
jgi:hypothetical protein